MEKIVPAHRLTDFSRSLSDKTAGDDMVLVLFLIGVPLMIIGFIFKPLSAGKPNRWVGIRTRSSMRSVEFWQLLHKRAMKPTIISGSLFIDAVPIVAFIHADPETEALILLGISLVIMFIWSIWIMNIHHGVTVDLRQRAKAEPGNQPIEPN